MRFDVLFAVISSGVYAPLALMAGGLLLALMGIVFLVLRRKKRPSGENASVARAAASTGAEEQLTMPKAEAETLDEETAPAAAAKGGRRRSLVGGAERDDGTPAGEQAEEPSVSTQNNVEEAEFTDLTQDEQDEVTPQVASREDDLTSPTKIESDPAEWEDIEEQNHLETAWIEEAEDAATEGNEVAAAGIAASQDIEATPPPISAPPISAELAAALRRPIAFRQFLPQSSGNDGLSFFGGQPIGPEDFQWPRQRGAEGGAPLQFFMQWDCAQLSQEDPTGLLPQYGVLYCFVNCEEDAHEEFISSHAFVHLRGSAQAWKPVKIPDDARPALGGAASFAMSGCTDAVDNAETYLPRILPRFPFSPIAFDQSTKDGSHNAYWSNEDFASALLDIQKSGVAVREAANETESARPDVGRPFSAFPHDFGAVRVIASHFIEALTEPDEFLAETLYPGLAPSQREEQFASWLEEAKEIYLLGTQRPQGQKLDQSLADDIWQWLFERKGVLEADLPILIEETVDLSLGGGSEALSNVPAEWIDRAMRWHALATECEDCSGIAKDQIKLATPARMFGPPSFGGAQAENLMHDHILLLELPSGAGPQHHFGGSVLQYWITPDDLAAGRFEAVKSLVIEP